MESDGRSSSGAIVACLAAAALFGASTPASKALLGELGPFTLAGALYLGAALAVTPWAARAGMPSGRASGADVFRLVGAVVFGGMVGPVLLLLGLRRAPAGSVALWLNLETVATAALARVFFKEHLTLRTGFAVALIVAASAMLAPGTPDVGIGGALVALACVAWGLDNNLTAVLDRFTPTQVVFAKGLIAGGANLALGLTIGEDVPSAPAFGLSLGVGALAYGLSLVLYVAGAQQLGAMRSQLAFSTAPAWGLALSWLWLDEPWTLAQLAAVATMAAAILLWTRERHAHLHAHERVTHTHLHRHDDGHHEHVHEGGAPIGWHSHAHTHEPMTHAHPHRPDLHHRHDHGREPRSS